MSTDNSSPKRFVLLLRSRPSIRRRLLLLVGLLVLGIIIVYVGASYYGVKDAAFAVGRERLRGLTEQLSTLSQQSTRTLVAITRSVADTEAVRDYMRSAGKRSRAQALAAMERIGPPRDTLSIVELWGANKRFLLGLQQNEAFVSAGLDSEFVQAATGPTFSTVGKIRTVDTLLVYPVVASVNDRGQPIGYVVRWRRLSSNPQALEQLSRLLGARAALYFGNNDGTLWTDLLHPVPAPPIDVVHAQDIVEYARPGEDGVVATARPIQGTPFILLIEFSREAVMSAADLFLKVMIVAGVVLLAISLVVVWLLSRGITKPLDQFAGAVEAIAGGDYSRLVTVQRRDEVGRLADAFNTMVSTVRGSQHALEKKVHDHKKAEEALRDSEERYRIVAETATDGIVTINEASIILFANQAIEKIFGYRRDELLGKELTMVMPEYLRHVHKAALIRYVTTGKKHIAWEGIELPGLHKTGKEIPLEVSFGEFVKDGARTFTGIIRDITERKQTERAIKYSEERLRAIIEQSPLSTQVFSPDGVCVKANRAWEELWSARREQLEGYNILSDPQLAAQGILPYILKAFGGELVTTPPVYYDPAGVGQTGKARWTKGTFYPVKDSEGKIREVVLMHEDITDRKQAEEALRNAEERYRHLFESNPLPMWVFDSETLAFIEVNPAAVNHYGYTREEFLRMTIKDIRPPGEVARLLGDLAEHHVGLDKAGTWKHKKKDGTVIEVEITSHELSLAGRKAKLVLANDVTERKRAEEALRISEQHKESLLRLSRQLEQAQTFSRVLEVALEEVKTVLGYQSVWAFLFDDNGETASLITIQGNVSDIAAKEVPLLKVKGDRMLEEIYAASGPVVVEDARTDPRTNKEIVEKLQNRTIINVPMVLADRKIGTFGTGSFGDEGVRILTKNQLDYFSAMAGHITVAFDRIHLISERRKAYEKIQKFNEVLEQRVAERTAQLEAANKELEAFSYSVSHDLRAPLRGIEGFTRLLLDDYGKNIDAEGQRFLKNVVQNTTRMGELIDDLLAFSRLSRQEMRKWTVDMTNLANAVVTDVKRAETGRMIHITLHPLESAVCDGAMMRQVWLNLISNAFKFTRRQQQPRIEIGSYLENGEAVYFVKDNGAGFDMKYVDKLFGVFQRLHRQDEFEGTGVGLGIVQRVVSRHGGRVWAEGKLNEGATFYFTLRNEREQS